MRSFAFAVYDCVGQRPLTDALVPTGWAVLRAEYQRPPAVARLDKLQELPRLPALEGLKHEVVICEARVYAKSVAPDIT